MTLFRRGWVLILLVTTTSTRWLSFVAQFVRYNFLICLTWIDMSMLSRRIRIADGTTDAQLLRLFESSCNDKGNNMVTRKVAGNHVGFIFMFQNSEKWLFFALVFSLPPQAFMRHHAKPATSFCLRGIVQTITTGGSPSPLTKRCVDLLTRRDLLSVKT